MRAYDSLGNCIYCLKQGYNIHLAGTSFLQAIQTLSRVYREKRRLCQDIRY